jgi:KUP system potassium uptake protein
MISKKRTAPDKILALQPKAQTLPLVIGALGVVYGDIGTSPLYAIRECFHGLHAVEPAEGNILGVLSLVFWSLTVVITVKYVIFILRADNNGEGGIFALLSLVPKARGEISGRARSSVVLAAVFGAALLYGDGIITPAISVLSAVEGLNVATTAAQPLVLSVTLIILFFLFMVQRRGTSRIGAIFGPVMVLWFVTIGLLGAAAVTRHPRVFLAVNPWHGVEFFRSNSLHGLIVLGSVVLCVTGGEALYADLGHFSRRAIRVSWLALVFPALFFNYFGQGARLLEQPEAAVNPFYSLVPGPFLYPMVVLSTMATIIASQAMISGIFSLTRQAVQLGYLPRMRIIHTSTETEGQIYLSGINWALMIACMALVVSFKESSRLAGAYGIAVTATMATTSILFFFVIYRKWRWSLWKVLPIVLLFLVFDLAFFGANLFKLVDGGWFTISVGILIAVIMSTWKDGREKLSRGKASQKMPLESFLDAVAKEKPLRIPGTTVFMTIAPVGVPRALLYHFRHNHVLHEVVVILTVHSLDIPRVPPHERTKVEELGQGFYRVEVFYGFMETPDVPESLLRMDYPDLRVDPNRTTYFLSRETLLTTGRSRMMRWRKRLFAFLSRNVQTPAVYFGLPPDRVIELGVEIEL